MFLTLSNRDALPARVSPIHRVVSIPIDLILDVLAYSMQSRQRDRSTFKVSFPTVIFTLASFHVLLAAVRADETSQSCPTRRLQTYQGVHIFGIIFSTRHGIYGPFCKSLLFLRAFPRNCQWFTNEMRRRPERLIHQVIPRILSLMMLMDTVNKYGLTFDQGKSLVNFPISPVGHGSSIATNRL